MIPDNHCRQLSLLETVLLVGVVGVVFALLNPVITRLSRIRLFTRGAR